MKISRYIPSVLSLGVIAALSAAVPVQAAPADQSMPQAQVIQVAQTQPGYWHGYHGSRAERPGTRLHDGYWYPDAAFGVDRQTTGSITESPMQPQPPMQQMHRQTYCQGTFGGTNGDGSMPCGNEW
ncbi:surface protein [Rhizobium sp. NPDC090275]|uniref:surface protein n=1 Tax=Rhizobium sp. NPDC090275 TaxID=3364498 RepID=UPI000DE15064